MHARFETGDRNDFGETTWRISSTQSQEDHMNDLLARAIAAHGGLERWNTFNKVTATVVAGGGLKPMKSLEDDHNPRAGTVTLHWGNTVFSPCVQPDWRMG